MGAMTIRGGLPVLPPAPSFPDAACRRPDIDPGLFFPSRGSESKDMVEAARAVRAICPHGESCANHAISAGARLTGIWGGTTDKLAVERGSWAICPLAMRWTVEALTPARWAMVCRLSPLTCNIATQRRATLACCGDALAALRRTSRGLKATAGR